MLLPLDVATLVACSIRPRLETVTVLFILFPLATILGTIKMAVSTLTMSFVIHPVAIIDIAICVDKASFTVSLVIGPVALVERPVWPDLYPFALANLGATDPFALVLSTTFQSEHGTLLSVAKLFFELEVIIVELSELLAYLFNIDTAVVLALAVMSNRTGRVELVTELLGVLPGEPHAEGALQLDNDVHLPCRVSLAI